MKHKPNPTDIPTTLFIALGVAILVGLLFVELVWWTAMYAAAV